MPNLAAIIRAAQGLEADDFLKLRSALDRVEERLWNRELGRVSAGQRRAKLSDAKIDEMVLKRRYRNRRP
jgi:hypothetical protein